MEQGPSREVNRSSASQEIPHILWSPRIYYRIHKSQQPAPILNQIIPVHASSSPFPNIHLNIILLPTPRSYT